MLDFFLENFFPKLGMWKYYIFGLSLGFIMHRICYPRTSRGPLQVIGPLILLILVWGIFLFFSLGFPILLLSLYYGGVIAFCKLFIIFGIGWGADSFVGRICYPRVTPTQPILYDVIESCCLLIFFIGFLLFLSLCIYLFFGLRHSSAFDSGLGTDGFPK